MFRLYAGVHRSWDDESRFEEGTTNYLCIAAVPLGLRLMRRMLPDVQMRVAALTAWLLEELVALRHRNGAPLVLVHGPTDTTDRGATISMTLRDPNGVAWDADRLEQLASEAGIALRAGAHCNPGANEVATEIDRGALRALYEDRSSASLEDFLWRQSRVVRGALRASLGLVSDFDDVQALVAFLRDFLELSPA